jgi:hypothetical protein
LGLTERWGSLDGLGVTAGCTFAESTATTVFCVRGLAAPGAMMAIPWEVDRQGDKRDDISYLHLIFF